MQREDQEDKMSKENQQDNKYRKIKKRIFDIIQIGNKSDFISRFFDIFIAGVIILNILVMGIWYCDKNIYIYPYYFRQIFFQIF